MAAVLILLFAAVAVVEALRMYRDARRARRMNRALHELRRPLQAIALSLESAPPDPGGAAACLEQARGALRDLDALVNGRREQQAVERAPVAEVLDALARRWHFADVEVERGGGEVEIDADLLRLGAALDNLVVNSLRHGSGIVRVRATTTGGKARFEVRDCGPAALPPPSAGHRDPRHGHGLRVVAGVASGHGGEATAARRVPDGGTLAAISLPVSGEVLGA